MVFHENDQTLGKIKKKKKTVFGETLGTLALFVFWKCWLKRRNHWFDHTCCSVVPLEEPCSQPGFVIL